MINLRTMFLISRTILVHALEKDVYFFIFLGETKIFSKSRKEKVDKIWDCCGHVDLLFASLAILLSRGDNPFNLFGVSKRQLRGIFNCYFDNGVCSGAISILKWGKLLVNIMGFSNASWKYLTGFISICHSLCSIPHYLGH